MLGRTLPVVAVLLVLSVLFAVGCAMPDGRASALDSAPGASVYEDDGSCESDAECSQGEACVAGVCTIKFCAGTGFAPLRAPLRSTGFLWSDRELLVTTGSDVQAYDLTGRRFSSLASGRVAAVRKVIDVAGGNFMGEGPESVAVATEGSSKVLVRQGDKVSATLELGFIPTAMAAGDTHMDGRERIIAAKTDGTFAVCDAKAGTCTKVALGMDGVNDVTVGDVDGDGYAEVVFLVRDRLVAYRLQGVGKSQKKSVASSVGRAIARIAAGDLDGDGVDEVIGLEHDDEDGLPAGMLHVIAFQSESFTVKSSLIVDEATDVAVGGRGGERPHVVTIGGNNRVEVLEPAPQALALVSAFRTTLPSATNVHRVGLADLTGDSVPVRLRGAPRVASGSVVPMAVLVPPPYSKTFSGSFRGGTRSTVSLGTNVAVSDGTTTSDETAESLSMKLTAAVAGGKGNIGDRIKTSIKSSVSLTDTQTVGRSFTLEVRPELDGFQASGVVLGCGCYNQYDYDVEDPAGRFGEKTESGTFSIYVPIGGQTVLWSLQRYNKFAAISGGEPTIDVPTRMGDLSSYPRTPTTLEARPSPTRTCSSIRRSSAWARWATPASSSR